MGPVCPLNLRNVEYRFVIFYIMKDAGPLTLAPFGLPDIPIKCLGHATTWCLRSELTTNLSSDLFLKASKGIVKVCEILLFHWQKLSVIRSGIFRIRLF
ncbi:hypothetical protein TNIN_302481 [Trichonephila inaurata madagascariensis]|uniref:Uncharacterized protein n=1 Tax=Trichonephila inaurata madagascariensis TaxID=2747483 RepID=A0A8X7CR02_9ARAC|nr:hypothetical protein TNIN_302481 [Trichonephila inaurata madagascariensis]